MSDDEVIPEAPEEPSNPAGTGELSHGERIEAALLGALAGERAAQAPSAAGDLLGVADSIASVGAFDADDLRNRGLAAASQAGAAGLLLRAVPYGLLSPLDRPRVRRDAYRIAVLAGADEGTAIAAIAAALMAADLTRFDPATTAVRVRQSLLEDAPFALLERLRPDPGSLLPLPAAGEPAAGEAAAQPATPDDDPGAALQVALTAVWDAESIETAIASAARTGRRAATSLAGVFAGARLGGRTIDDEWRTTLPHSHRASAVAAAMAAQAGRIEDAATEEPAQPAEAGTLPSPW
jgi:hypothetical protein